MIRINDRSICATIVRWNKLSVVWSHVKPSQLTVLHCSVENILNLFSIVFFFHISCFCMFVADITLLECTRNNCLLSYIILQLMPLNICQDLLKRGWLQIKLNAIQIQSECQRFLPLRSLIFLFASFSSSFLIGQPWSDCLALNLEWCIKISSPSLMHCKRLVKMSSTTCS